MPRYVRFDGSEVPPPPEGREPNPDWVEPKDGEIVSVLMTYEGSKKGVYNAKIGQVEWSPYTFSDLYPD